MPFWELQGGEWSRNIDREGRPRVATHSPVGLGDAPWGDLRVDGLERNGVMLVRVARMLGRSSVLVGLGLGFGSGIRVRVAFIISLNIGVPSLRKGIFDSGWMGWGHTVA